MERNKRYYNDYKDKRASGRRGEKRTYYERDKSDSHKRKREDSPTRIGVLSKLVDIRSELRDFLEEHARIKQLADFWTFFEKYQAAQSKISGKSDVDKTKLLYFNYETHIGALYEKLPILDRNGRKLDVDFGVFKELMAITRIYEDFQQKSKFAKLKKLREAQRDLPMAQYKQELIEKLASSRVILIAGDTGCGKSTQVPQYILEAGYKKIVCTQPRRIACVSLAKRVAYETLNGFKDVVGYQIRFEKSRRAETRVIFMTEGLLLRHASDEDTLKSYDVIILDEVHERHLHGDFLIGIMKCLLQNRSDFKLILMSATINIELFKNYFEGDDLHVIQVPGRLYPIDIKYFPVIKDPYERKSDRFDSAPYLRIIEMIDKKYEPHEKGDLLVFLNGFSEISALAESVNEYALQRKNWIVLILHSSLSLEEQDKVFDFAPESVRKCIISTNIAETSVTIDGVRFVIDSGKVNRMSYVTTGGVNKLTEVVISQDSAKQRAGRAGRTGPGICYRLYSEEEYNNFEVFTPVEIHLVPLDSLLLHMISLGLRDVSNFPFLEKPDDGSLEKSVEKLKFSGALNLEDDYLQLTALGEALSRLPVDLTIGKMLITSTVFENVDSVLILAALLTVQSPVTQKTHRNLSDLLKSLDSNHGDPISLLNYYKEWLVIKRNSSVTRNRHGNNRNKQENSKNWCRKRGLEEQRFYEVTKLFAQFRDILIEAKLVPKNQEELSRGERAIRNGELKQLRSLRYELKNEARSTKRKYLKFQTDDSNCEDDRTDLRDVEFRILNDTKILDKLLGETSVESYKSLTLLKLILTCGLYPQFAVEDEFNGSKTVSEKLFHTKAKNYIFLRPNSYFALNYEVLELCDDDIEVPPPGYFNRRPLSRKHQILVYQSILETKKVFLVNTMRMPALQTLLLFSKTIACNATFTKFVFDDFLMVHAPYFGQGNSLMLRALELRKKWHEKLERKLRNPQENAQTHSKTSKFTDDLLQYTQTEVVYNFKRLLPADLKIIYNSNSKYFQIDAPKDPYNNPFDPNYVLKPNQEYGGLQISENVVYNCLVQEEWEFEVLQLFESEPFECPSCRETKLGYSLFEVLQHEASCRSSKQKLNASGDADSDPSQGVKPNSRLYSCPKCQKELHLTPVEILKHKKICT